MKKRWHQSSLTKHPGHWLRLSGCFLVGLLVSLLVSYQWMPMAPLMAQVLNNASVVFTPATGARITTPVSSNTTQFDLGTTGTSPLTIVKTADRAAAEPADVVIYRLLITNSSTNPATPLTVTDLLPRGIQYVQNSARATPLALSSVSASGAQLTFQIASLPANSSVSIFYAVTLTPDAIRGSGRNVAQASAPGFATVDTAFQLAIRPGILRDCGTIIGRVFVDKNFDGEQQSGEPGVPNAVVFLDDGNRIITDPDGLFSVANVISGHRVGALDLSSLPGYTLAPNLYHVSDNSQSRLVRLEPGGLARMNFAVTPTYGEGQN